MTPQLASRSPTGLCRPRSEASTSLKPSALNCLGLPGRGLLIVFTDGVDTSSWLPAESVLQAGPRSNAVVYAVSTSPLPRRSFLRDLSDLTGGGAVEIASTENVSAAFVRVLDEFRQRYVVAFSPTNVAAIGWHALTVRVKNRKLDVKARPGYAR